jgi:transcriptional regulator with XRE-family HTH domain
MEQTFFPVTRREAERVGIQYSSEANKKALFPTRLRELRVEKGVSQEALSKVLGVSKSTIGLWENGDTLPDAKAIYDLAEYFKVSTDYILCRTRAKTTDADVAAICKKTGLTEDFVKCFIIQKEKYPAFLQTFNDFFAPQPLGNLLMHLTSVPGALGILTEIATAAEQELIVSLEGKDKEAVFKCAKKWIEEFPEPHKNVRYWRFEAIDCFTKTLDEATNYDDVCEKATAVFGLCEHIVASYLNKNDIGITIETTLGDLNTEDGKDAT